MELSCMRKVVPPPRQFKPPSRSLQRFVYTLVCFSKLIATGLCTKFCLQISFVLFKGHYNNIYLFIFE